MGSALQRTDRHASQEYRRDVQAPWQCRTLCLHARLIEVNSRMTQKIQDLEQTVSGFKSDQYSTSVPEAIDFSKIEADLTELKTFLYKAQSCTSRTDTSEGSLTVKRCNVSVVP